VDLFYNIVVPYLLLEVVCCDEGIYFEALFMPRLAMKFSNTIGLDRQGSGRDRNADLWDYCPADNGSDSLLAILFAAFGPRPCRARAIRGGLAASAKR
jgi:hypothetical protein